MESSQRGMVLAWRAGVYGIEPVERERHRVGLHELERVAGLRRDVDAGDVEPGAVVAHGRAPGAAEQVQQPRPHGRPRSAQERRSPAAMAVTAGPPGRATTGQPTPPTG